VSSQLDPVTREAVDEATRYALDKTTQTLGAWWNRFWRRRQRLPVLTQGASELASLFELSNLRSRNFRSILHEVADLVFETGQFQSRFEFTVTRLLGSLPAMFSRKAFFRVALLGPADDMADMGSLLKIRIGHNYSRDGTDKLRLGPDSVAGVAFSAGRMQYVPDRSSDPRFTENVHRTHEYYTLLCIPLSVKGKRVGVLNIDGDTKDCLTQDDQDAAKMAARILEFCLALEQLQEVSRTSV
jgi:GAF domain-containing protein